MFRLHSDIRQRKDARELVSKLRRRALNLDFLWVGYIYVISGRRQVWDNSRHNSSLCLQIIGDKDDEKRSYVPKSVIAFDVRGKDHQAVTFGLCRYPLMPARSRGFWPDSAGTSFRNIDGWRWNFCFGAISPDFFRMIEYAEELGILDFDAAATAELRKLEL